MILTKLRGKVCNGIYPMAIEAPAKKVLTSAEKEALVSTALSDVTSYLEKDEIPDDQSRNNLLTFIRGQINGRKAFPKMYPKHPFEVYFTKGPTAEAYVDIFMGALNMQKVDTPDESVISYRHPEGVFDADVDIPKDTDPLRPGIRIAIFF